MRHPATPFPEPAATPTATPTPAPTPTPTPTPTVASPVTHPDLTERIAEVLADETLPSDERLAVSVVDERGHPLFSQHAEQPLLPASTLKLVTAAAALTAFDPEHRFRTEVRATAAPGDDGVLDGDLVLVGSGDPALATDTFAAQVNPQRPRTRLEDLADAVADAGIRVVRGRVLGDGTVFSAQPQAEGWPERYLQRGDTVLSAGLTVNAGRRLIARNGVWYSEPAPNPASEAAAALSILLARRDVVVEGGTASAAEPVAAEHHVASVDSPPLHELLRYTVQRSDNHLADTVFRALGSGTGDGSWASADRAARDLLAGLELDWDGAVLADGSGLSRHDRLTAGYLTSLDVAMTSSDVGPLWQDLMAVSSRSGTLRRRLGGTVAEGRLLGKTGSLRDVRSLSGMVLGPDERRYHFAVLGNDLTGAELAAVRALQDRLVLVLAEDLYGCVEVATGSEDEHELECAA